MKPFYGVLVLLLAGCSSPSSTSPVVTEAAEPAAVDDKSTATSQGTRSSSAPTPPPAPLSPEEEKRGALTKEEYDYAMVLQGALMSAAEAVGIKSVEELRPARTRIDEILNRVDALPEEPEALRGARTATKEGLESYRSALSAAMDAATSPTEGFQDLFVRYTRQDLDRAKKSHDKVMDIITNGMVGKNKTP